MRVLLKSSRPYAATPGLKVSGEPIIGLVLGLQLCGATELSWHRECGRLDNQGQGKKLDSTE